MAARRDEYHQSVFINCPFDSDYTPIFEAIVFAGVNRTDKTRCTCVSGPIATGSQV